MIGRKVTDAVRCRFCAQDGGVGVLESVDDPRTDDVHWQCADASACDARVRERETTVTCDKCKRKIPRDKSFSYTFHYADYYFCDDEGECMEYYEKHVRPALAPVQKQAAPSTVTPSYYITGTYEPRKVIQAWGLGWALGNAVAYIARAGKKPGNSAADDISKAANDLLMELDHMGVDVRALCEEMVGRIEEGKK